MGCWGCVGFEVMECFFSCFSVCNGYPTSMVITTDRRVRKYDRKAWKSIYIFGGAGTSVIARGKRQNMRTYRMGLKGWVRVYACGR